MTRKNIFELLKEKYNIEHEMNKITTLFNSQIFKHIDSYTYKQTIYTIENIVDNRLLFAWKQRNCCLSCNEIRAKLNLEYEYSKLDNVILILEYYENLIYLVDRHISFNKINYQIFQEYFMLKENIANLLDYINYEIHTIEKEEKVLIVPKNPSTTAVAEISDEETAMAILMYNHHTLKGDLERKRQLLNLIQRTYEPLLKSPIEGYKDFYEKTNQLLNNLHIRHNNLEEVNNKNLVININDKTLEHWYDELYQLLLFCVLIDDNLKRKKEAGEFLKQIKQGA